MSNVVLWKGITRLDLPPERTLNAAIEAELESIVVIGFDKNGEFFFAGNKADGGETLWLLELAKKNLLEADSIFVTGART